jgi:hypothetical protein
MRANRKLVVRDYTSIPDNFVGPDRTILFDKEFEVANNDRVLWGMLSSRFWLVRLLCEYLHDRAVRNIPRPKKNVYICSPTKNIPIDILRDEMISEDEEEERKWRG